MFKVKNKITSLPTNDVSNFVAFLEEMIMKG